MHHFFKVTAAALGQCLLDPEAVKYKKASYDHENDPLGDVTLVRPNRNNCLGD